jgi:hypothetical protein
LTGKLKVGMHALRDWGYRLGEHKGEYTGGFEQFNETMLAYCVQDVKLNVKLLELLRNRIPDEAALMECEVARICRRMRLHGVAFDRRAVVHRGRPEDSQAKPRDP